MSTVIDTEGESRRLPELDQAVHEQEQLCQMVDTAIIITPVIATDRDVENGEENVIATDHDGENGDERVIATDHDMENGDENVIAIDHDVENGDEKVIATDHDVENGDKKVVASDHDMENGDENVAATNHDAENGDEKVVATNHDVESGDEKIIANDCYVENGDEKVIATDHDDLPRSDDPKCGITGKRWFAIGAILLIVGTIAVTLALVLPPNQEASVAASDNNNEETAPPYEAFPLENQDLFTEVKQALDNWGIPTKDMLVKDSYQYKAFMWLTHEDTQTELLQQYILTTFYYSTYDVGHDYSKKPGPRINATNWLTAKDAECTWGGIKCDDNGYVNDILPLQRNNLSGKIPWTSP